MAFRETSLPDELAHGSSGGPLFKTHVVVTKNGNEQRNQCWRTPLSVYEVGLVNRETVTTTRLRRFYRSVAMGRRHGFRFTDPLPGESTGTLELLGTGNGTQTVFQLVKHYTLGAYSVSRTITKPVVGSVTVFLDGVGTGAFTVNTTTGLVTMTVAPAGGVVVRASYQFQVPVRFDADALELVAVEPGVWSWPQIRLMETRAIV